MLGMQIPKPSAERRRDARDECPDQQGQGDVQRRFRGVFAGRFGRCARLGFARLCVRNEIVDSLLRFCGRDTGSPCDQIGEVAAVRVREMACRRGVSQHVLEFRMGQAVSSRRGLGR